MSAALIAKNQRRISSKWSRQSRTSWGVRVTSAVASTYAPAGQALVAASVPDRADPDDRDLLEKVRDQLAGWFGPEVAAWRHLRSYPIRYALPDQGPASLDPVQRSVRHPRGLYVCGDHRETGSMQGAMASGRRAATAILEDRAG